MDIETLKQKALEARELSYSPYSHFAVGAAILCADGSIYVGANIENASYPLCMCAERNAIYNAMLHGKKKEDFLALAVVADAGGDICTPCGACRQVISELFPAKAPILMGNTHGKWEATDIDSLLPFAFSGDQL